MMSRPLRALLLALILTLSLAACVQKHATIRMPVDDAEQAWILIHTRYEAARSLLKATEHTVAAMSFPDPAVVDVALYRHVLLDCFTDEIAWVETDHVACQARRSAELREHLTTLDADNRARATETWRQVDELRVTLRVDARDELRALEEVVALSEIEVHRLSEIADDMRRYALVEDVSATQRQRAERDYALVSRRLEAIGVLQETAAQELATMQDTRRLLLDDIAARLTAYGTY